MRRRVLISSRTALLLSAGLALIEAGLLYQPIRNGVSRGAILLIAAACCVTLISALWWSRIGRWIVPLGLAAMAIFLLLPGSAVDRSVLRATVVRSLLSYQGTTYVWGGENHVGIDCSGLARHGIIDACLWQGCQTFNPRLVRIGLIMWWQDCSARELDRGYTHRVVPLTAVDRVQDADDTLLLPGDFCVTADGSHTMAYLGDRCWIEADPTPMRVIRLAPGSDNGYYTHTKVHLLRWALLQ